MRVALVTCAALPDLDPDDRRLLRPLRRLGVAAVPAVWSDPSVDWSGFDLAVLRSTWDYPRRRGDFLAWAARSHRLRNPAHVVSWNTDKRYLVELDIAGVPVVPTTWVAPGDRWHPPADGAWVVKPAVGAGSRDCGRYLLTAPQQRRSACEHVERLQHAGRLVMVQPYLRAVERYGETGLVFLADAGRGGLVFSHAVRKAAMLDEPDGDGRPRPPGPESVTPRVPSAVELATARRALAAVPGGTGDLLYARVDLVPDPTGRPVVGELELTEPSLFLRHAPAAAGRFAAAIAAAGPPAGARTPA